MTENASFIPASPNLKAAHRSLRVTNQALRYGEFSRLAKAKGWTAAYLADRFRGKIESPSEFFHRVLDPRNAGREIPYQSVLDFYRENIDPAARASRGHKSCACGCGRPLFGRKKYATGYCRVKMCRKRSATRENGPEKATETKRFSVIKPAQPGECLDVNS